MSGYYLVSRQLNDPFHDLHPHSTGEPACAAWAWVDLIGMARWKDAGGIPRGTVPASERFLAVRWNWHRSRVTRFLADLEATGRITREPQTGRKSGHISICNYDTYQDPRTTSEPQVGPRVGPRVGPKKNTESRKKESGRARKHALPDTWRPSDSHREKAATLGVSVDSEAESFRLHAQSHGRKQVDWDAAFHMWLRKAKEFRRAARPSQSGPQIPRVRGHA